MHKLDKNTRLENKPSDLQDNLQSIKCNIKQQFFPCALVYIRLCFWEKKVECTQCLVYRESTITTGTQG